jgi:hypothetical protein
MTNITIPPMALEAAQKAFYDAAPADDAIEAACLAMLAAWPGMERKLTVKGIDVRRHRVMVDPHILLPLPKEPSDGK